MLYNIPITYSTLSERRLSIIIHMLCGDVVPKIAFECSLTDWMPFMPLSMYLLPCLHRVPPYLPMYLPLCLSRTCACLLTVLVSLLDLSPCLSPYLPPFLSPYLSPCSHAQEWRQVVLVLAVE